MSLAMRSKAVRSRSRKPAPPSPTVLPIDQHRDANRPDVGRQVGSSTRECVPAPREERQRRQQDGDHGSHWTTTLTRRPLATTTFLTIFPDVYTCTAGSASARFSSSAS